MYHHNHGATNMGLHAVYLPPPSPTFPSPLDLTKLSLCPSLKRENKKVCDKVWQFTVCDAFYVNTGIYIYINVMQQSFDTNK